MANALFSFQLQEKNRAILERKKSERGWAFGRTINTLLETFTIIPDSIKTDLLEHIKGKLSELVKQMDQAESYKRAELMEITQKYLDIATYLSDGKELSLTDISTTQLMQKIPLKNGLLICPKSYLIVNPEEASVMEYACVIECQNSKRYNIPHYLIFCDRKYGSDYDDAYQDMLLKKLMAKDPGFTRIMNAQVKPISDPQSNGKLLNAAAYAEAPTIGIFNVYEHGDPRYPVDYEAPDGTEIIRSELLD